MYKIKTFSKLTGLTSDTLRYYEKLGLLQPTRNNAKQRVYTKTDIDWVEAIIRLKTTGMPLAQIIEYAKLRKKGDVSLVERHNMLLMQSNLLAEKRKILEENQKYLDNKIKIYYQKILESQEFIGQLTA